MNIYMKIKAASLIFFFGCITLFSAVSPSIAALETREISVGTDAGDWGDIVSIPITIDNPAGIGGISFSLLFEQEVLEFQEIVQASQSVSDGSEYMISGTSDYDVTAEQQDDVASTLFFQANTDNSNGKTSITAAAAQELTHGTIFNAKFKIREDTDRNGPSVIQLTETSIQNADAGYSALTTLPVLVGVPVDNNGEDVYPQYTVSLNDGFVSVGTYSTPAVAQTPSGYIADIPSTYPLLTPGTNTILTSVDTARTCSWTVTDWEGTVIDTQTSGSSTYTINPDTLFAANGAGIYTVSITDMIDTTLPSGTLKVRVPMQFTAANFASAAIKNAGTYTDDQGTDTYTITGGPSGNVYYYTAYDLDGVEVTAEACGSFATNLPTASNNLFNITNGIDNLFAYRVNVMLDITSEDADVTRLIDADLYDVWSGIFRIIPIVTYSGTIVNSDGITSIAGATVTATHDNTKTDITDVNGEFSITGLLNTGAALKFFIHKDGYVSRTVTAEEINEGAITLEALGINGGTVTGTVTLSDDPAPYAYGTVTVMAIDAAENYITDAFGEIISVIASSSDGTYSFPIPDEFGTEGPFNLEFFKTGYIYHTGSSQGVLAGETLNSVNADITLKPVTKITVSGTPVDLDSDSVFDQVQVTITAAAGLTPLVFDGTSSEIRVLDSDGNDLIATLDTFASTAPNTWSFTHDAYENFSITVEADVGDDRDVDNDYKAVKTWTYVMSAGAPALTDIVDPNFYGGTASSVTGDTLFNLPPGGLTGDVLTTVTIVIVEADAGDAGAGSITGSELIEVTMLDAAGEEVSNADIQRIEITIQFDPTVVTEGSLESGAYRIYTADSILEMISGITEAIPVSQLITPIDYTNGSVTFWVNHLSVFGIGGSGSVINIPKDQGCFIATAAYGSIAEPHVKILRQFRDIYLMPSRLGKLFVDTYYKFSPPMANFIAEHEYLRAATRIGLMPLIGISYAALHTSPWQKVTMILLMLGIGVISCTVLTRKKRGAAA